MNKLILIPQESMVNALGYSAGYGIVRFQRENEGKIISERLVKNIALWDALRAKRKSSRQAKLIKKVMRAG